MTPDLGCRQAPGDRNRFIETGGIGHESGRGDSAGKGSFFDGAIDPRGEAQVVGVDDESRQEVILIEPQMHAKNLPLMTVIGLMGTDARTQTSRVLCCRLVPVRVSSACETTP